MNFSQRNIAMISILVSSGVWGLFWIPLRYLNENGIPDLWAITLITGCTLIIVLPIALWRREFVPEDWPAILLIGSTIGAAMTLYFAGLIWTDVVRVVFLFYLLPVWTALITRFVFGEKLGAVRSASILAALFGVWLLLGEGAGLPVPQGLGDWCALASGLLWAICLISIRKKSEVGTYANLSATFFFSCLFSLVLILIVGSEGVSSAEFSTEKLIQMTPIALLFAAIVLFPSMIGQVWGARYIESPLAALLTMSEIIFATLSAWYLIGTTLSTLSIVGGIIIISAVAVDLFYQYRLNKA